MPATPSVDSFVVGSTSVTMTVTAGLDTTHLQFDRDWVDNGGSSNDLEVSCSTGNSTTQVFSKPTASGTYMIYVRARSGSNPSSWVSRGFTVSSSGPTDPIPEPKPVPTSFNWDVAKTPNGIYNLTYSEWNGLLNKVNEFLVYKFGESSTISFNRGVTSGLIAGYVVPSALSFNRARDAVAGMSPSISPPSRVSVDQIITSAYLNGIRNSLNSIT